MLTDAELVPMLARDLDWWKDEATRQSQMCAALADRLKLSHPERKTLLMRLWFQFGGEPSHGIPREDL